MAKKQITQGKWGINASDNRYDFRIESVNEKYHIASVKSYPERGTGAANARLIAKAPEMLKLLKKITKGNDFNYGREPFCATSPTLDRELSELIKEVEPL
jgi:hypothetical protein